VGVGSDYDTRVRPGRRPGDIRYVFRSRRPKLPRTLGAPALFAACYGNVGSSIYYALGVTAAFALGLTPLALILAGAIFVTTALNYAEGTTAIPHAGGSSSFARKAFNDAIGFLVGWIQLLNYTATVAISSYFAIGYLGIFAKYLPLLEFLKDPRGHSLAAVALTGILIIVNIIGIQESSLMNLLLALLDLGTQVVLVVLGALLLLNIQTVLHNIHLGVAPTWGNFLASVSIAMVTYTGIETISNMSEEVKNPSRAVPRATFAVIAAVLFVSAFLPTIGMSVFPVHMDAHGNFTTDLATTWKDDPVAGIVTFFHPAALAFWAGIWVGVLAFTILVIATNAGLIGISRLSYSLATSDLFPSVFCKLHPRFKTPFVSIIVFGVAAAVLILPAQIDLMAAVYSLAATFAFAAAHLAVMRLRFVAPTLPRPFKMPLNIRYGRASIPVLSVLGAVAIGSVFTQLLFQNIDHSTYVYLGWLVLGVIAYVAYRLHRRDPLWEPLATPPRLAAQARFVPIERPPRTEVVHAVRRRRGQPARAEVRVMREPRHRLRMFESGPSSPGRHAVPRAIAVSLLAVAVSALAVAFDLSPLDPFGPSLGWSPGVLLMVWVTVYLILRGKSEHTA
jgi:APA family basic amino acid/polyamine antiporter